MESLREKALRERGGEYLPLTDFNRFTYFTRAVNIMNRNGHFLPGGPEILPGETLNGVRESIKDLSSWLSASVHGREEPPLDPSLFEAFTYFFCSCKKYEAMKQRGDFSHETIAKQREVMEEDLLQIREKLNELDDNPDALYEDEKLRETALQIFTCMRDRFHKRALSAYGGDLYRVGILEPLAQLFGYEEGKRIQKSVSRDW